MNLPVEKKRMLYQQALQKYLKHTDYSNIGNETNKIENEIKTPVTVEQDSKINQLNAEDGLIDTLKVVLPKTIISKGIALYKYLKNHTDINWDDKGKPYINGEYIEHTNIIDIISDLVRNKTGPAPKWWKKVKLSLEKSHTPASILGNENRIKELYSNFSDEDENINTSESIKRKSRVQRNTTARVHPYLQDKLKWTKY